jgi:hypothetical protein
MENVCTSEPRRYLRDPLGRRLRGHRTPTGVRVREQPRDIAVAKLLAEYRFLRSSMIWSLLPRDVRGGSYRKFQKRLTTLFHETETPYGAAYLDWPQQQDAYHNARYTSGIFAAGQGAEKCLARHGIAAAPRDFLRQTHPSADGKFPHSLLICDTIASIEAGLADNPKVRLITWGEIFAKAPVKSRAFPVTVSHQFGRKKRRESSSFKLIPDGLFGIEFTQSDGRKKYVFFALEAECKNRVDATDLEETSWLKKYLGYRYILKHRLYLKRLGLPHLYILTTTPTQARIDTMKQIIMDNTEQRGGTPFFFHPMPVLSYRYPQMKSPPVPNLFASPLERAGHPAMRLDEMGSA